MAVEWESIDPSTYERAVAVLLATVFQDTEHVDGRGGDEGRDVIASRRPDGLHIYELKSYWRRLTTGQKREIERSLAKAAQHKPTVWTLVIPLDHSPAEMTWFDRLAAAQPFRCVWLDRTWLDAQMASQPQIERNYLAGRNDEVVRLLQELGQGQAVLQGGVGDAVERLDVITERLNEIDAQYTFQLKPGRLDIENLPDELGVIAYHEIIGSKGQPYVCEVKPRYPGAERDRPLTLSVRVRLPKDSDPAVIQAIERFLDYGESVDLGSEYIEGVEGPDLPAMGSGRLKSVRLRVFPADMPNIPGREAVLNVQYQSRQVSLPARIENRGTGFRGGFYVEVIDETGVISVVLRLSESAGTSADLKFSPRLCADAMRLCAPVNFADLVREGALITIELFGQRLVVPVTDSACLVSEDYAKLVRAVVKLQVLSGNYFRLPDRLTSEDLLTVEAFNAMLEGRAFDAFVPLQFDHPLPTSSPRPWRRTNGRGRAVLIRDVTFEALSQSIHLGALEIMYDDVQVTEIGESLARFESKGMEDVRCLYKPGVDLATLSPAAAS